jgi:very-short-patch-repair endonuclease
MTQKTIISYNPNLKEIARKLRNNSTMAEVFLWRCLKGKQMLGYDFDRQKPIDRFVVDFYCKELKLAIEIDGSTHDGKMDEDRMRQERLESLGVRFLRFSEGDVKRNLEGVVEVIKTWIAANGPTPSTSQEETEPTPTPPQEGITSFDFPPKDTI